ncbi:hypothetical protein [Mesonia sp.]|uniref:hypothetical protein n=1 Tax=Mesonia sp. TaxID=1960830 RepID=UPI003F9A770A
MKKQILYVITSLILLSCGVQKFEDKTYEYSDDITFEIKAMANISMTENVTPSITDTTYITKKGSRFKRMVIKFNNHSNMEQTIDFSKFYLLNDKNLKYKVHFVMQYGKAYGRNIQIRQRTLSANKERSFLMEFHPAFAKGKNPKALLIEDPNVVTRDKVIPLLYLDKD